MGSSKGGAAELAMGCERCSTAQAGGQRGVVAAEGADIFGHLQAMIAQSADRSDGSEDVGGEDRFGIGPSRKHLIRTGEAGVRLYDDVFLLDLTGIRVRGRLRT